MAISRDILVSALFPDTCEEKPPVKDMVEEGVLFKNGPLSKGSDITTFTFHDHDVRVMIEDQPWFFAADVSKVLGYRRVDYAVRILDEDEKSIRLIQTDGGAQKYSVITEPGLYRLLMRSDRPEAKPFQKWVVSEVLPALRKSGAYSAPTTTALLTKDTP
jgi:prophage antirepressor-like protein